MTREGYVVYANELTATFELMYTVSGGCSKGCTNCASSTGGCDIKTFGPFKYDKKEFTVKNGNSVSVEIYPKTHLVPGMLMLIFPILEFFFAYWLFFKVSFNTFIISSIALAIGYFLTLIVFNKIWKKIIKGKVTKVIR